MNNNPERSSSMISVPVEFGKIADMSDRKESTRFTLNGVCVTVKKGKWDLAATDSKMICIVSGKVSGKSAEGSSVIPADAWRKFFSRAKQIKPIEGVAKIAIGDGKAVLSAENPTCSISESVSPIEGRFPAVRAVVPKEKKYTFRIDAKLLATVCQAAASFTNDDEKSIPIDIEMTDPTKPIVVRVVRPVAGVDEAMMVVMPIANVQHGGK